MFSNMGRKLAALAAGVMAALPGTDAFAAAALAEFQNRRTYRYWHLHKKGWHAPRARHTGAGKAAVAFPTRQIERDQDRRAFKRTRTNTVRFARAARGRALTERQSRREMTGFYSGAMALAYVLGNRCGRLRRQRRDDTGKWTSGNLVGWA